ncbi:MAG: lipase family protein [Terrimicrobiaceae bacterium]|nr:lipase family protein [Terrimicrobiaceae bacterium]
MPPLAFHPLTTRFDADNALALAAASNMAYNPNPVAAGRDMQATLGCNLFHAFDTRNTQGFVAGNDEFLILAFRGSEKKWGDWMDDFRIAPVNFDYLFPSALNVGHIHNGFGHAFRDAQQEILTTIRNFQTRGQTLWITGHSLGAADAVIATALLLFDNTLRLPVNGLYTFGQPRVGDSTFAGNLAQRIGQQYFRFVNDADLVTRIPPRELGYVHTGRLVFFDGAGHAHTDEGWWNRFLAEVSVGLAVARNFPVVVVDHDLQTGYIDHIAQYQRELASGTRQPLQF